MIKPKNKGAFGLSSPVHYAWIVIAIAAIMHMAGGSIRQAFGVLIVPLEETRGWSPAMETKLDKVTPSQVLSRELHWVTQ